MEGEPGATMVLAGTVLNQPVMSEPKKVGSEKEFREALQMSQQVGTELQYRAIGSDQLVSVFCASEM
ncbi:MAG: hypothetical protein C5B49_03040 [Bdellovibrio sp.]|nr:MAG: hypothetical protein C5B49_03040 [Bdellovibrio sp.]